jgi:predicted metal-dependent hydrolase
MSRPDEFKSHVKLWASRLRVKPKQVRLQIMSRKWASCSSRGRVTFCLDLLRQPDSFQDYVIAHELLHLRVRNHGKLFKATLRTHLRGNPWLDSDIDRTRP